MITDFIDCPDDSRSPGFPDAGVDPGGGGPEDGDPTEDEELPPPHAINENDEAVIRALRRNFRRLINLISAASSWLLFILALIRFSF